MPGSESEYPFRQEWHGGNLQYFPTPQGFDIYSRLLPEWAGRFATGQEKYRDVEHLGARGVFPDVNRKTGRLKSDIWEERTPPEGAEPTREVILDLIGHLFLMLHLWDQEPLHGLDERDDMVLKERSNAPWEHAEGLKACPDPDRHGDGWDAMPNEAREVLRAIAGYQRVTDAQREAVGRLVEKHDAQEPS